MKYLLSTYDDMALKISNSTKIPMTLSQASNTIKYYELLPTVIV